MEVPPAAGGALALAPAAVGGKRHKLKLVTKKRARKVLKKLGLKIRGGAGDSTGVIVPEATLKAGGDAGADAPEVPPPPPPPAAGRRRSKKTRRHSRRRSLFGY